MPKYTRIKKENGTVATSEERPDILADHFENIQWGTLKTTEEWDKEEKYPMFRNNKLFEDKANISTEEYSSVKELKKVIKKAKANKAPGPDEIPGDVFKYMDDDSLLIILNLLNSWKQRKELPKSMTEADVVTIFKKGNV